MTVKELFILVHITSSFMFVNVSIDGNIKGPLHFDVILDKNVSVFIFTCALSERPVGGAILVQVNLSTVDIIRHKNNSCYDKDNQCKNNTCVCSYEGGKFGMEYWYKTPNVSQSYIFGVEMLLKAGKTNIVVVTLSRIYNGKDSGKLQIVKEITEFNSNENIDVTNIGLENKANSSKIQIYSTASLVVLIVVICFVWYCRSKEPGFQNVAKYYRLLSLYAQEETYSTIYAAAEEFSREPADRNATVIHISDSREDYDIDPINKWRSLKSILSASGSNTFSVYSGILKRRISILRGYQDQWFILTEDGLMRQYEKKPSHSTQKAKWQMNIILADIDKKKDGKCFNLTSNEGRRIKLKAQSDDEREKWIKCFKKINHKFFPHSFPDFEDEEEEDDVFTNNSSQKAKEVDPEPKPTYQISFGETFKSKDAFPNQNNDPRKSEETVNEPLRESAADITKKFKEMTIVDRKKRHLMVAAIDFGLIDSGSAYSLKNPFKINVMGIRQKGFESLKVPTVLHLKTDRKFVAFGFDAESIYSELLQKAQTWYYFSRFKMQLYNNMAGIDQERLTLILEPEAAALCCKCLEIQKRTTGNSSKLGSFDTGAKFIVVDLGGGTIDITIHEILASGKLKEIHSASGGPWGGNTINEGIWKLLQGVFGENTVTKFIAENRDDYIELARTVELKKRTVTSNNKVTIGIPRSLMIEAKKTNPAIIADEFKDQVKLLTNKLQVLPGVLPQIFKEGIDTVIKYVQDELDQPETKMVSTFLLVGKYATCELLKDAMKTKFNNLTVIVPLDSDVVVSKGAVIMGHMETPIVSRIAKCHYGIVIPVGVDKQNMYLCSDLSFKPLTSTEEQFHTIIKKGQPIQVNEEVTEYDFPITFKQDEAFIRIYASDDTKPPKIISKDNCRNVYKL